MYDVIKIGDKDYPYKFNKIATSLWEQKTGKHRRELTNNSLEDEMLYIHCAMEEGHKMAKKPFKLTIDDLWNLEREHDFYDSLLEAQIAKEKK